ncbi:hypothetical protein, partial [Salmonella enterica]|uniref:hypothetical protein n=1 Tax=Salmonella enterica TaxID=28901 RepID=UPI001F430C53
VREIDQSGDASCPDYKDNAPVGRIAGCASPTGSHKTVLPRRPDKTLRVANRQPQNSTRP